MSRPEGDRLNRAPIVGLAAVILAILVAQFAVAGGSDGGKIASLQRQINQLKAQVAQGGAKAAKKKSKRGPRGPAGPPGLKGAPGQDFVTQGTEPWHELGAEQATCVADDHLCGVDIGGETCGWVNNFQTFGTAAYLRDRFGFVHLKGAVYQQCANVGNTIFILPAGYRPAASAVFAIVANDAFADVYVNDNGGYDGPGSVTVHAGGGGFGAFTLDGINFRCGPSGSDGCP